MTIESLDLPDTIAAIAALGTAAFALVDSSKAFWGGVSNAGFRHIQRVVSRLAGRGSLLPLGLEDILATLRANWLNGAPLVDQKAIAKSLIKLRLTPENTAHLAQATGVNAEALKSVAEKIANGTNLEPAEADVYGRFDLILTAMLDEGYQRADQAYRNQAKAWAVVASVLLAVAGGWQVDATNPENLAFLEFAFSENVFTPLLIGLLATPLAPISKDLSSALAAAVRTMQMLRK